MLFNVFFVNGLFAEESSFGSTVEGREILEEFLDFRMKLSKYDDKNECLRLIDDFKNKMNFERYTQEESLILENLVILEVYNYKYGKDENEKELKTVLAEQKNKVEKFLAENKGKKFDKWIYCSYADIISCSMSFSFSDVLKYGVSVKDFYNEALKVDPDFCYAALNLSQWYFWAPSVTGGGKKKAEEFYEKAFSLAKKPWEKYYAGIYYSQCLFENKKQEKCKSILSVAYEQFPESTFIKEIKLMNENGYSLFEGNKRKSKIEEPKNR